MDGISYPELRQVMKAEFASLSENHTWDYVNCESLNNHNEIGKQRLLDDLIIIIPLPSRTSPTVVFTDSTGCLLRTENARFHEWTEHIDKIK
jgi:hypothetical protein